LVPIDRSKGFGVATTYFLKLFYKYLSFFNSKKACFGNFSLSSTVCNSVHVSDSSGSALVVNVHLRIDQAHGTNLLKNQSYICNIDGGKRFAAVTFETFL
jgi:hypothetical protein